MPKIFQIILVLFYVIYLSLIEVQSIELEEQPAVKMQLRTGVTKASNEVLEQPALGRPAMLGCLYYGSRDYISPTKCFWDSSSLEDIAIYNSSHRSGKVSINTNTLERLSNLDVEGGLSLSFFGGLIKVSGSAEYLRQKRLTTNSISVSYFYTYLSSIESLTQKIIQKKDYPFLCNEVGKPEGPTHVVSSITRGGRAIFSFSHETKHQSHHQKASGMHLKMVIQNMGLGGDGINGNATFNLTSKEKIAAKDLKCSFTSDFAVKELPTNYIEAVETYKDLINLSSSSGNVLKFQLEPIHNYCDGITATLNQLSDETMERVKSIVQELEDLERTSYSLTQSKAALTYTGTLGQAADLFLADLKVYTSNWKESLRINLPLIRGGTGGPKNNLDTMISQYEKSAFNHYRATSFLKYRKKEIDTVELALNEDDIPGIFIDDNSADVNKCSWDKPFKVKYELNVLPKHNIVESYIAAVNESTREWTEAPQWYDNNQDFDYAASIYNDFVKLRIMKNEDIKNKEQKDNVCFFITLNELKDSDKYAKIVVYNDLGQNVKNDLGIVSLEKPKSYNVTSKSIEFEVPLKSDGFTDTIDVQIKKFNDSDNEITKSFKVSPDGKTKIKVDRLIPATLFQLTISATSKVGRSSPYYELGMISTNSHSEPQNLKILDRTSSTLSISWKKPAFLQKGVGIIAYKIAVRDTNSNKKMKDQMVSVDVNSSKNEVTTKIIGLQDSTSYDIEVTPKTNQTLDHEETQSPITRINVKAMIQASTLPKAPQSPIVMDQTYNSISLKLEL